MFRMLKGMLAFREHVDEDSVIDWNQVEDLINCLKDVADLTTKMQAELYPMGNFYRDLKVCVYDIEQRKNMVDPDDPTSQRQIAANRMVDQMLDYLQCRTVPLLSASTFAAAIIICDPRLNMEGTPAITPAQKEEGIVSLNCL